MYRFVVVVVVLFILFELFPLSLSLSHSLSLIKKDVPPVLKLDLRECTVEYAYNYFIYIQEILKEVSSLFRLVYIPAS